MAVAEDPGRGAFEAPMIWPPQAIGSHTTFVRFSNLPHADFSIYFFQPFYSNDLTAFCTVSLGYAQ
jgi:hypothetical protein